MEYSLKIALRLRIDKAVQNNYCSLCLFKLIFFKKVIVTKSCTYANIWINRLASCRRDLSFEH